LIKFLDLFTKRIDLSVKRRSHKTYIIHAHTPGNDLTKHHGLGMHGINVVDFSNNMKYDSKTNYDFWVEFHSWSLIGCWTVAIDVSILLVRFGKKIMFYSYMHSIITSGIYIATLCGVFCIVKETVEEENFWIYGGDENEAYFHYTSGFIICVIALFQSLNGFALLNTLVTKTLKNIYFKKVMTIKHNVAI